MSAPGVCDLHDETCTGEVRECRCANGCGYVVRRCEGHGGRSLGGAIGGHARICNRRGLLWSTHGRWRCLACGRLVRAARLYAHQYDVHGIACCQHQIRRLYKAVRGRKFR